MASLTAAEPTIRRTLPCSHLLNRKDISETAIIFRRQPKRWVHMSLPVNFCSGKDSQRRPGRETPLAVCVFPGDRFKRPMSFVAREWGGGVLACDSVFENQSG